MYLNYISRAENTFVKLWGICKFLLLSKYLLKAEESLVVIYTFIYLCSTTASNEASEENVTVSLQKDCEVSPVPDEANSDSSRKQEAHPQPGQKVTYVHLLLLLSPIKVHIICP